MKPGDTTRATWHPRSHWPAACAAATATTAVFVAVLLTFDSASPRVWLRAGPELAKAIEACDAQAERGLRVRCKQQLAAAELARSLQPTRMAAR